MVEMVMKGKGTEDIQRDGSFYLNFLDKFI